MVRHCSSAERVLPDTFKPGYRVSDWHAAFPAQAEKGLKELIKAALEEDSDDDDKPGEYTPPHLYL